MPSLLPVNFYSDNVAPAAPEIMEALARVNAGPEQPYGHQRLGIRTIVNARVRDGIVVFGPTCMKPGDAAIVIRRARAELGPRSGGE